MVERSTEEIIFLSSKFVCSFSKLTLFLIYFSYSCQLLNVARLFWAPSLQWASTVLMFLNFCPLNGNSISGNIKKLQGANRHCMVDGLFAVEPESSRNQLHCEGREALCCHDAVKFLFFSLLFFRKMAQHYDQYWFLICCLMPWL